MEQERFCSCQLQQMVLNTGSQDLSECLCTGRNVDTSCNSAKVDKSTKEDVAAGTSLQDDNSAKGIVCAED